MSQYTWTPCEDSLPDDEITVLISNPAWPGDPICLGFHDGDTWRAQDGFALDWETNSGDDAAAPTHWMSLPPNPVSQGQRIVIILGDDGTEKFTFSTEFEPCLNKDTSGGASKMFAELFEVVCDVAKRQGMTGHVTQLPTATEEGR